MVQEKHASWLVGGILAPALHQVVATREPGDPAGRKLRELLLHEPMHLETEALLMFAARREHLDSSSCRHWSAATGWFPTDLPMPALRIRVGGVEREKLETLEEWVQGSLQPGYHAIFDAPLKLREPAWRRRATRQTVRAGANGFLREFAAPTLIEQNGA